MLLVGDARLHEGIDHAVDVAHFLVAPVAGDRDGVCRTASRTAAIIRRHHRPAARREQLLLEIELECVLPRGTTVHTNDRRQFSAGHGAGGEPQDSVHLGSVVTLRDHGLDGRERNFVEPRVVMRELPRGAV